MRTLVQHTAPALEALLAALPGLETTLDRSALDEACGRGWLRPGEEERLLAWFARWLTVRTGLWEIVGQLSEPFDGDPDRVSTADDLRAFVLAYGAGCAIVRLDRYLVEELARDPFLQRKLNEGAPELHLPRKQYTAAFESLSHPRNALSMLGAMRLRQRESERLAALSDDEQVGFVVRALDELERSLDPSRRRYLSQLGAFAGHALRRRGASARQQAVFKGFEGGGRLMSELRDPWRAKKVDAEVLRALRPMLRPGDVFVTRHEGALTNLFLPGFWPHASLFVGSESDRERMGVELDPQRRERWSGECCVLEALKDGVLYRPLEETLAVDAVGVLRPRLSEAEIATGLGRVSRHEGKLYNFDFDFARSDRLVCTEVVYRAFDGLGSMSFELRERAGRPTLSAEDLIDLALDSDLFEPLALFGTPACGGALLTGPAVAPALAASYR